jgi:hypothetical protein
MKQLIIGMLVFGSINAMAAEFPKREPANFLNGDHLISSKGTTQFPIMGTIF